MLMCLTWPVADIAVLTGSAVILMIVAHIINLTKSPVDDGTSVSHISNKSSVINMIGEEMQNIRMKPNLDDLKIRLFVYAISPDANDLMICGLVAIKKFTLKLRITPITCMAIPLAAFTIGQKNKFNNMFIPCTCTTSEHNDVVFQPIYPNSFRIMAESHLPLNVILEIFWLQ